MKRRVKSWAWSRRAKATQRSIEVAHILRSSAMVAGTLIVVRLAGPGREWPAPLSSRRTLIATRLSMALLHSKDGAAAVDSWKSRRVRRVILLRFDRARRDRDPAVWQDRFHPSNEPTSPKCVRARAVTRGCVEGSVANLGTVFGINGLCATVTNSTLQK